MKRVMVLAAIAVLTFFGCETPGRVGVGVERPAASVEAVSVTGLTFSEAEITTTIRVVNPNAVGVSLTGFGYTVEVEGVELMSGDQTRGIEIAARGESTIDFPVELGFANLIDTVSAVGGLDEADVAITAELRFDLPLVGRVVVPVRRSVIVPVVRSPMLEATDLVLESITLTGARLGLVLRIHNPNAFSFALDSLAYSFSVDDRAWVSAATDSPLVVPAGGGRDIAVPVTISFSALGRAARDLLLGGDSFPYSLVARAAISPDLEIFPSVTLPLEREGRISIRRR